MEGLPCNSRPVSFTGAPFPPFHRESALIIQSANLSLRGTGDRRGGQPLQDNPPSIFCRWSVQVSCCQGQPGQQSGMDDGQEPVGTVVALWPPAPIRDWKEDIAYASHSEMFPLFQY